jgi:predicted O-methyltransferase YrrM
MENPLVPEADPTAIYRARDGIFAVEVLVAAITHLDLFTLLSRETLDVEGICKKLSLHPRMTDVMVSLFVAQGFLEREGARVRASATGREFLAKDSPTSLVPYYDSLRERPLVASMLAVLRTGTPAQWSAEPEEWARRMADEGFARRFTAEMECRAVWLGPRLARAVDLEGRRHLLDIGGASGVYACVFVTEHPSLRATVLEKPPVDAIARKTVAARGLANRVSVVAGDMFQSIPEGADVHLFSNVLHDWNETECRDLLARSHAALAKDALLVIHDAFLNREKTGPLHVAEYSVLLAHFTEGRCWSVGEMEAMLVASGFDAPRQVEVGAHRSALVARRV